MKKLAVLFAILGATIGGVEAQEIGISGNPVIPVSTFFGDPTPVSVSVTNLDTVAIGSIQFPAEIIVVLGVEIGNNIIPRDTFIVNDTVLQPGEVQAVALNNIYNDFNFDFGGNVVVIWPAAPGVPTADSAFRNLEIIDEFANLPDTLGIGNAAPGLPPAIFFGDTSDFTVDIVNKGTSYIESSFDVIMAIEYLDDADSLQLLGTDTVTISGQQAILAPGESISVPIQEIFQTTQYRPGGNVVVIWPSAPQVTTKDSLKQAIIVDYPTGIDAHPGKIPEPELVVYPNPASDRIFFRLEGKLIVAEQVRILDVSGRLIQQEQQTNSVALESLQRGTYILEIFLPDNRFKAVKILKSE